MCSAECHNKKIGKAFMNKVVVIGFRGKKFYFLVVKNRVQGCRAKSSWRCIYKDWWEGFVSGSRSLTHHLRQAQAVDFALGQ